MNILEETFIEPNSVK